MDGRHGIGTAEDPKPEGHERMQPKEEARIMGVKATESQGDGKSRRRGQDQGRGRDQGRGQEGAHSGHGRWEDREA